MLTRSKDTIGIEQWVSDGSIIPASQKRRQRIIQRLAKVNGCESPGELLQKVFAEELTPYSASLALINDIRKNGFAPLTIAVYRTTLPVFWESVLGDGNFSRRTYDRLVPGGDMYALKSKKVPTIEELKRTLLIAKPRDRALLGFLASTGCRISEALSRKMSDIEERKGYARVNFQAKATKARTKRYAFITGEVLQWIRESRQGEDSQYVFPGNANVGPTKFGFKKPAKKNDKPLSRNAASVALDNLFLKSELHDKEDEVYTAHSFRTFCDAQMRKTGLDSKYVSAIIGHKNKLQSEAHYLDWQEIEESWHDKCLEYFTWKLNESFLKPVEVIKEVVDTQARRQNRFLLELFGKLLTPEQREKLDAMIAESGTFYEFKPGEYNELLKLPLEERRKKLLEVQKQIEYKSEKEES